MECWCAVEEQFVERADDPRVDDFRDLKRADRRPDRPGGRGLVVAEGVVVVRRLLASDYPVRAVLGVRGRIDTLRESLRGKGIPVFVASADVMAEVVGFHLNRGVLAVADRAQAPSVAALAGGARRIAVLEGVGDHENLGSVFRNAAALGIDGVVLGPGCADPLYRRSVRVSMGHVLGVPFATNGDLPEILTTLRGQGFTVVALTPSGSTALAGARAERVAVLLGSEGHGLSEEALAAADVRAAIPMARGVDSLNVATAAAVAFYELARE
jgi:tRNA G18 (ribose-2'-O)-methylase SpoU